MPEKPLWHEDKTVEEIMRWEDPSQALFNLHEDILCLKEEIEELKKQGRPGSSPQE